MGVVGGVNVVVKFEFDVDLFINFGQVGMYYGEVVGIKFFGIGGLFVVGDILWQVWVKQKWVLVYSEGIVGVLLQL